VSDADAKGPRRYESPKRRQQARATRRAIVEAGRSLFLSRGYGGTTIEAIAGEAGVAVQTVYAVFGSKPHILRSVLDVAVTGEDAPAPPLLDPDAMRVIGLEPDPARRVRMFAALVGDVLGRTAAVTQVAREAAAADPEMAQMWRAMQDSRTGGMAEAARVLVGDGDGDGDGLPVRPLDEIRDLLWVLCGPEVHQLFVAERLWTPERYEEWLVSAIEPVVNPRPPG